MKCAILLVCLIGLALGQVHNPDNPNNNPPNNPDNQHHGENVEQQVVDEVGTIYTADNTLTVDQCAAQCDAFFDEAIHGHDVEVQTDHLCLEECRKQSPTAA